MIQQLSERAERAVTRYGYFLNILRSQADIVLRRGGADMSDGREDAVRVSQDAARSFLGTEQAELNEDTMQVAFAAHSAAMSDLGLSDDEEMHERIGDFIFSAAAYVTRILAAQAERDVMTMAQHIQVNLNRIDLYARSGRYSRASAAAAVMIEDNQAPAFRFLDRMGRRFKATKHIRDIYRQHLLNIYNEVYMDAVATHGHDSVFVSHPEPTYKWFGQELLIVSGSADDIPLYYDVREEIFHPSSSAIVTILDPGAD